MPSPSTSNRTAPVLRAATGHGSSFSPAMNAAIRLQSAWVAAVLFLLWLAFTPAINNLGQVLVIVALAVLAIVGIELLRRQTAEEFPRVAA